MEKDWIQGTLNSPNVIGKERLVSTFVEASRQGSKG
jgi:hypothetical protein